MRSHFMARRGFALACAVAAALGVQQNANGAALDTPADPVYDDGWQPGDNGGFGFGPWNMDGTYTTVVQHSLDTSDAPDNIRVTPVNPGPARAWSIFNPAGPTPGAEANDGTDISRAGRAILGGLQVGQTLSMTIDNPTERNFFRGWQIQLNTGGANGAYAGDNATTPAFDPGSITSRMSVGTFEYFTNGQWFASNSAASPTLFDTDTNDGLQIDITLTGPSSYALVMTSPGNAPFATTGTLVGAGTIDWIEFEYFGTDSDFHGTAGTTGGETDFYISRVQVVPEPSVGFGFLAASGLMLRRRRARAPAG